MGLIEFLKFEAPGKHIFPLCDVLDDPFLLCLLPPFRKVEWHALFSVSFFHLLFQVLWHILLATDDITFVLSKGSIFTFVMGLRKLLLFKMNLVHGQVVC